MISPYTGSRLWAYIVNPVRDQDAPRIHPLVERSAPSPNFFGCHLCRIHGYDHTQATHSQASNKSSRVPGTQRTRVDRFDDCTKHENGRGANDGVLTTILVGERIDDEAGDEGSQLLQADRKRVYFRDAAGGIFEILLKGLVGQDPASHTGIIASQERRDAMARIRY